jgi:hypothetical protein
MRAVGGRHAVGSPCEIVQPRPHNPDIFGDLVPRRAFAAVLLPLLLLAACGGAESDGEAAQPTAPPSPAATETAAPTEEPTEEAVDPAEVGANELGEIPVLMYHRLLPDGGGEYDLTPEEFRGELQYLYDNDYRPIRTIDLVEGDIDVPAGMTPVVLTFDDSTREQAAHTPDGDIDPDTAIGILLEFAEEHPDFTPVASLYINAGPFGGGQDSDDILVDLHERGFELGNHTHSHANLRSLDADGIREELARGVQVTTDVIPQAEVRTLSLPLGIWPEPRELAYSGDHDGFTYENEGILLVGSHPALSPFHGDFDPQAIPRIRSTPGWDGGEPDYTSGFWFDVLERHPERRYVSDGNPATISFPAELADDLDEAFRDAANPYDAG